MRIGEFNSLERKEQFDCLFRCCGSGNWANKLCDKTPFSSIGQLLEISDEIWSESSEADAMEAFSHHPKIGDITNLEKKFASTKEWAGNEQSGVNSAKKETLQNLAIGNAEYEKKFGFIFIVCATGKSADEMLALLNERLPNDFNTELKIAMSEQNKITHIRLKKLFE